MNVDAIFGDGITTTSHRVMASVFDGDPEPLYDIILDPNAEQFIRQYPSLLAMLERIEQHSPLLMLAVTASGGQDGKLNKLRGAGYVVKCDHPSVTEGAWPAEALAITEAGRTALVKHRTEVAEKKGRRGQAATKGWYFVAMASATSFFSGTIGSGLHVAQIMALGTTSTRRWRIPVTPRPEREPVSYCAAAMSAWLERA